MNGEIAVKICGITRPEDARLAAGLGVEFLGINFYEKSPRSLRMDTFRKLRSELPPVPRVFVQVRPEPDELREAEEEGFDFFQLHFAAGEDRRLIEKWAEIVTPERLWLAPKVAPNDVFPGELLPFADTILVDTYRKDLFGGTGETGDWSRFRQWAEAWPDKRWVLAGGLTPENVLRAIEVSGASVVDFNSGIESAPGKKDPARMKALAAVLAGEL